MKYMLIAILGLLLILAGAWGGSFLMASVGSSYQAAALLTGCLISVSGFACCMYSFAFGVKL